MLYLNQKPDEWSEAVLRRVGRNIRKKRMDAGYTINRLYAETGIQRVTIQRWESGERSPRIDDLLWLCKCTGWKLAEILGVKNDAVGTNRGNKST